MYSYCMNFSFQHLVSPHVMQISARIFCFKFMYTFINHCWNAKISCTAIANLFTAAHRRSAGLFVFQPLLAQPNSSQFSIPVMCPTKISWICLGRLQRNGKNVIMPRLHPCCWESSHHWVRDFSAFFKRYMFLTPCFIRLLTHPEWDSFCRIQKNTSGNVRGRLAPN